MCSWFASLRIFQKFFLFVFEASKTRLKRFENLNYWLLNLRYYVSSHSIPKEACTYCAKKSKLYLCRYEYTNQSIANYICIFSIRRVSHMHYSWFRSCSAFISLEALKYGQVQMISIALSPLAYKPSRRCLMNSLSKELDPKWMQLYR